MSEPRGPRRRGVDRHQVERTLAPHVDPAWTEDVILELRLLGVSGVCIGAALAEADAHCADSGERAAESIIDAI